MNFFLLTILNIVIFVTVRYLSLLSMFLLGMGAADHYKYESFGYLPGTAIQLSILLILSFRKRVKEIKGWYQNIAIAAILIFLSIAGLVNIIPYSIIPF